MDEQPTSDGDGRYSIFMMFSAAERMGRGRYFQIPCTVVEVHEPEIIGDGIYRRMTVRSRDGRQVMTVRIPAGDLLEAAERARARGTLMMLTGRFVGEEPLARRRSPALVLPSRLEVQALAPLAQVMPLLAPSAAELTRTEALYEELRQAPDGIHDCLLNTFYTHFEIASAGQRCRGLEGLVKFQKERDGVCMLSSSLNWKTTGCSAVTQMTL